MGQAMSVPSLLLSAHPIASRPTTRAGLTWMPVRLQLHHLRERAAVHRGVGDFVNGVGNLFGRWRLLAALPAGLRDFLEPFESVLRQVGHRALFKSGARVSV